MKYISHRISLAPMINKTDRHFRYLLSLLTKRVLLYSEMYSTPSILKGNVKEILKQSIKETNCVLQIASNSPEESYQTLKKVDNLNYCEYNLNLGCPSEKVRKACYGAYLMRNPNLVKEILSAMKEATNKPISAKIRVGVKTQINSISPPDNLTSWDNLTNFVETISSSGITTIQAHARIAILEGLCPKDNRQIPPLLPNLVYKLSETFPHISFVMNGGIKTLSKIKEVLDKGLAGVMIGRSAYNNPYLMAQASRVFLEEKEPIPTRREVLEAMHSYITTEEAKGLNVKLIYPHLMGLWYKEEGAQTFRKIFSPPFSQEEKCSHRFDKVFKTIPNEILDKRIEVQF